jgi:ATP-dependent Lon protease
MPHHKILALDNLSLQEMDPDSELIPLMTPEDEEEMNNEALPKDIAILPLRNTVLFPGVVIPITAGRDKSIKLINDANAKGKIIGVVAQKDENVEEPSPNDIHHIGTVARIMRVLKMPDGNTTVILQGKKRFEIEAFTQEEPYLRATIKEVSEERPDAKNVEFKAIIESINNE